MRTKKREREREIELKHSLFLLIFSKLFLSIDRLFDLFIYNYTSLLIAFLFRWKYLLLMIIDVDMLFCYV
jgi:hypothetical protein